MWVFCFISLTEHHQVFVLIPMPLTTALLKLKPFLQRIPLLFSFYIPIYCIVSSKQIHKFILLNNIKTVTQSLKSLAAQKPIAAGKLALQYRSNIYSGIVVRTKNTFSQMLSNELTCFVSKMLSNIDKNIAFKQKSVWEKI